MYKITRPDLGFVSLVFFLLKVRVIILIGFYSPFMNPLLVYREVSLSKCMSDLLVGKSWYTFLKGKPIFVSDLFSSIVNDS